MSCMRWDADTNIRFIEEYQRQVCLWDPKDPQYKNKEARDEAYRKIIESMEMDLTVKLVISKIRSLRNTYNAEVLKMKKSISTGKLYSSKIPWLSSLDFLKNIESYVRTNTENLELQYSTSESSTASIPEDNDLKPHQEIYYAPARPPKRTKRCPLTEAVKALEKVSSQQRNDDDDDEFDSFGCVVAKQLRTLPVDMALETEEIILSILRKQRAKVLHTSGSEEI